MTEHLLGGLPQFLGDVGGFRQRLGPGDRLEIGEPCLEMDRPTSQPVPP